MPGAIFKGLAIANTATGPQIYATDFHNGSVDVWDANFAPVKRPGAFTDPDLPRRLRAVRHPGHRPAAFVVTYAKQDADAEDDVAGPGNGFVDVYDTDGDLLRRFAPRGALNSPWGIAPAPQGFGAASGALLIGNFGDGRINAYDPVDGRFLGALREPARRPIADRRAVGAGVRQRRDRNARRRCCSRPGPADESHGLFGELTPRK